MCRFLSCFFVGPGDETVAVDPPESNFLVSFTFPPLPSLARPTVSPLEELAGWEFVRLLSPAEEDDNPSSCSRAVAL